MSNDQAPKEHRILDRLVADEGVTRRQFMQRATALGVSVATASSIWTSNALAAQQRGGHLRVAVDGGSTSDTLDITWATGGTHSQSMIDTFRNKLVDYIRSADGRVSLDPDLATEWGHSNDGKRWTFKLRQGVEFHNGKTLDGRDVVDSMNLHRGEDTKSGGASLMKIVSDIRVQGNDVIFDLNGAAVDFPFYLGQNLFTIGPPRAEKSISRESARDLSSSSISNRVFARQASATRATSR